MNDFAGPAFDDDFRERFRDLVNWRRDVRRYQTRPVPDDAVQRLIEIACRAPSVGNCQPWRYVLVERPALRRAVADSFTQANSLAAAAYPDAKRELYVRLKLEGLETAPVHIAVFADEGTAAGDGLGRMTMPEMLHYSVVGSIQTLWLAARAENLGLGWVSIIEPAHVTKLLDVPPAWRLIAYLCMGWPVEEHLDPELERHGWQHRIAIDEVIFRR